jgi:hypothetical protein
VADNVAAKVKIYPQKARKSGLVDFTNLEAHQEPRRQPQPSSIPRHVLPGRGRSHLSTSVIRKKKGFSPPSKASSIADFFTARDCDWKFRNRSLDDSLHAACLGTRRNNASGEGQGVSSLSDTSDSIRSRGYEDTSGSRLVLQASVLRAEAEAADLSLCKNENAQSTLVPECSDRSRVQKARSQKCIHAIEVHLPQHAPRAEQGDVHWAIYESHGCS